MKTRKILIALALILSMIVATHSYADTVKVEKVLSALGSQKLTSLQKMDTVEKYKNNVITGKAKVRDILRSFSSSEEAVVYLQKTYSGHRFEIMLTVDKASAEGIRKGKKVNFEGTLVGVNFDTLRLKDGKITKAGWWIF